MKFNENSFTVAVFHEYSLDGFGFNVTEEYSYAELENENLHEPNLFLFLAEQGYAVQSKQLFDSNLRKMPIKKLPSIMTILGAALPHHIREWEK